MKKHILKILFTSALMTLTSSAYAQNFSKGFYAGASIGSGSVRYKTTYRGQTKKNDYSDNTGYKLFAGYQFNKYFSLEGNYNDFGKFTNDRFDIHESVKLQSYGLSAVGSIPLGDSFSLFGKVGLQDWNNDYKYDSSNYKNFGSESGINANYGIGLNYLATQHFAIRTELESYKYVAFFSVGAAYNF